VAKAIHDYYRQYAIPAESFANMVTIGESVPGYEASVWYGIAAPKGTPPEIVEKLNQAVNAVLADPRLQPRLAELGGQPMPMTPAEFGKLVAAETEKWGKVIKLAGIKPE
jgi:tripartite-type tricarboxylate transporter receptor subunit TctC